MGGIGIITKHEIVLAITGGVFVLDEGDKKNPIGFHGRLDILCLHGSKLSGWVPMRGEGGTPRPLRGEQPRSGAIWKQEISRYVPWSSMDSVEFHGIHKIP